MAGEREEGYTGGDQRDESTVSHFLILLPGVFSLGYLIADPGSNRQRTQRRPRNLRQAVLADELRSWLEKRRVVRVWRRKDWKDRRRQIDIGCKAKDYKSTLYTCVCSLYQLLTWPGNLWIHFSVAQLGKVPASHCQQCHPVTK